ncbi:MAG TPA: phosphodiester glycosidase family protein [Ktedonobacteraceae bacterium]|nr:phosphodiester glycosidase family protein [Ktedonobacteraceae bacterium]
MHINKLIGIPVGADLSRTSPIYQPSVDSPLSRFIKLSLLLCLLIFPLASCDILPSVTVSITPAASSSNGTQLNVWNRVATGVEVRYEDWKNSDGDDDTVTIVRFDLHKIKLSVGYQPGQPLSMNDWTQLEHPLAIINGGYFDQQFHATALVVSNGKVSGQSYTGFGGMLSVDTRGSISLRSLRQQPYNPNSEQLVQATQSSPVLMSGGKRTQFNADASQTRRSIVAMDKQGRLLFIVSPNQIFSLDELADQLVSSDLSIEIALNLDGGSSTGLYVNGGSSHVSIDSLAKLPLVIIVKAR